MTNVLVRDLPDDIHRSLQLKAERRHQSLQQYLVTELSRLAKQQQISDILDEIEARRGGRVGFSQAVQDVEAARGER